MSCLVAINVLVVFLLLESALLFCIRILLNDSFHLGFFHNNQIAHVCRLLVTFRIMRITPSVFEGTRMLRIKEGKLNQGEVAYKQLHEHIYMKCAQKLQTGMPA